MAYGMQQLRKAGQAIRKADDAYAGAIRGALDKAPNSVKVIGSMGAGLPITYKPEPSTQAEIRRDAPEYTDKQVSQHQNAEMAMAYGLLGVNAGVRYGIPLTAAGLALNALSHQFGGQADQQERGQLPL